MHTYQNKSSRSFILSNFIHIHYLSPVYELKQEQSRSRQSILIATWHINVKMNRFPSWKGLFMTWGFLPVAAIGSNTIKTADKDGAQLAAAATTAAAARSSHHPSIDLWALIFHGTLQGAPALILLRCHLLWLFKLCPATSDETPFASKPQREAQWFPIKEPDVNKVGWLLFFLLLIFL